MYDFGFGMNWKGVIHDARTAKYVGIIKKPIVSVSGTSVTITCATPGAKIYYTTDGSTPSFIESHVYTKPFTFKKGAEIKAIAKIYGKDNSSLVEYASK
jgi:beta-glucosidase